MRHYVEPGSRLDDVATLQRVFFESVAAEFAGPGTHLAFTVMHLSQVGGNSTVTASVDFTNAFVAGSIRFGQADYDVDVILGPVGRTIRYGIREWADAAERTDIVPRDTRSVLTVSRMKVIVTDMARAVAALQDTIASAPAAIVDRMERARARA